MRVELDQPEWNQVLAILADVPWRISNPLIVKIGEQLRAQAEAGAAPGRPNGPLEASEAHRQADPGHRPS